MKKKRNKRYFKIFSYIFLKKKKKKLIKVNDKE